MRPVPVGDSGLGPGNRRDEVLRRKGDNVVILKNMTRPAMALPVGMFGLAAGAIGVGG